MKKKVFLFLLCLFCISTIIIGCQKNIDQPEGTEEDDIKIKQPAVGGELVLPIIKFNTINPIVNDNESVYFIDQLIYDSLLKLDTSFKPIPALAENWELLNEGTELEFNLRDNIVWHDGMAFTAEDVKFTIDTLKMSDGSKYKTIYSELVKGIDKVKVLGPLKVSIELKDSSSNFLEKFTFPIIPKHVFKNSEEVYKTINTPIVGTGSFKVNSYDKYGQLDLISNTDYWGENPYIEKIAVKIVPDNPAALTSVEANEIDAAQAQDYDWEKFAGDKSLSIYEYITQEYEFVGFNFENDFLKDINIRKAIAFGVDRHKIAGEVYLGHATVIDTPIHPDSYLFNQEAQKIGYDKDKAKEILNKSNWENRDADEVLENEAGEELRFSLLINNSNSERLKTAEIIASQLRAIGIDILINAVDWEEYEKRVFEKDYDILIGGWHMPIVPNLEFFLRSSFVDSTNISGYSDPIMDTILDQASKSFPLEMKVEQYIDIQNKFVQDLPYFSLFYKNSALIVKKKVKGDITPNYYNLFDSIYKWYLLEED